MQNETPPADIEARVKEIEEAIRCALVPDQLLSGYLPVHYAEWLLAQLRAAMAEKNDLVAALRLANGAMEHLGNKLNAYDMTTKEDEDATTEAFETVHRVLYDLDSPTTGQIVPPAYTTEPPSVDGKNHCADICRERVADCTFCGGSGLYKGRNCHYCARYRDALRADGEALLPPSAGPGEAITETNKGDENHG